MTLDEHLANHITLGRIKACHSCGDTANLYAAIMDAGPHYAKVVCAACNDAFAGWLPKPDRARPKRDGRSLHLLRVIRAAWGDEPLYCLVCLRDERSLPERAWMEAHHVIENQDAGADVAENLQPVCNECHTLIHWRRRTVAGEQVGKTESWEVEHAPG
jgi:hypothetical protein